MLNVLLTDFEEDFVEMDPKTKISNADAKKLFSVLYSVGYGEQEILIDHLNKLIQHKITSFFNKS